ncbi:MAG: hypothetical protein QOI80_947, partial [Solirubrobacteraceae bacterium]|nr:hypothetical protein [Solirubrobacteraceae bacterium]
VPSGGTVAVDGGPPETGAIRKDIALSPGQAFKVTFTPASGSPATHYVRCVPHDLPQWRVERHGTPVVRWIAFAPTERKDPPAGAPYSVIADGHGVPVWWARASRAAPVNTTVLPDGTVAWARLGGPFSQTYWDHVKLDGTALDPLTTVGTGADHHELQILPNGNRMMIAYRPRRHVDLRRFGGPRNGTVIDGEIQELAPDGKLVWSWRTKTHIGLRESTSPGLKYERITYQGKPAYDLIHTNSISVRGDRMLVSGKGVSAVYLVRRSDGRILWKLGGTRRKESLTIKGDRFDHQNLGGQHDARLLPDGSVSVHDNGEFRHHGVPRILRFRINTSRRTATLVQELTDKRVGPSYCCGSAERLSHGHWLVDWGANPIIEELRADSTRVLTLTMPRQLFSYRAQSVPRGILSRDALRAGMDAMHPR